MNVFYCCLSATRGLGWKEDRGYSPNFWEKLILLEGIIKSYKMTLGSSESKNKLFGMTKERRAWLNKCSHSWSFKEELLRIPTVIRSSKRQKFGFEIFQKIWAVSRVTRIHEFVERFWKNDGQTDRQKSGQKDGQTDRQADWQINWQADRQTVDSLIKYGVEEKTVSLH